MGNQSDYYELTGLKKEKFTGSPTLSHRLSQSLDRAHYLLKNTEANIDGIQRPNEALKQGGDKEMPTKEERFENQY